MEETTVENYGKMYWVKYKNFPYDKDAESSLLSEEEMRFCPWVLYEWKRKFYKSTPTPLGASSNANKGCGEFHKYIEGLEEGEQCIRIAVIIYFQHRFAESFLKDQLAPNKSNSKVSYYIKNKKIIH